MTQATVSPVNQKIRVWISRGVALACIPFIIFMQSAWSETLMQPVFEVVGALVVVAAVLGRFWSILYIGGRKNNQVVQDGPYSMCRHPLYLSTTIGAIGLGLMLGSLVLAALLGLVAFVILSMTAAREERFLRSEFAPDYDLYAQRVPRIWPDLSLFRTEPEVTFNAYVLRRNLADALGFLALIPFAELMETLRDSGVVGSFTLP